MINNYKPEIPSQYKGEQIILSSGRVIFNAKNDSIMFFAKKSLSFSSAGTFNIDSDDYTIINAPKIYLGLHAHTEREPILLGTQTNNLLLNLISSLETYTSLIKTGNGSPQAIMAATGFLDGKVKGIKTILKNKELLSKQNFTI